MAFANIEHIIVVMLENRSFDNVLGALYPSRTGFDGVGNAALPNLWNGKEYRPQHGTDLTQAEPRPQREPPSHPSTSAPLLSTLPASSTSR